MFLSDTTPVAASIFVDYAAWWTDAVPRDAPVFRTTTTTPRRGNKWPTRRYLYHFAHENVVLLGVICKCVTDIRGGFEALPQELHPSLLSF